MIKEISIILEKYDVVADVDHEVIAEEILLLFSVVWRSEQFYCPSCKMPYSVEEIRANEHCNNCGHEM